MLQLYSDTIVFYGFIGFVATIGCLVHFNKGLRDIMHTRIVIGFLKPYLNTGVGLGEGLLGTLVLVLYVYWLWFWRWGYDRIENVWYTTDVCDARWRACACAEHTHADR